MSVTMTSSTIVGNAKQIDERRAVDELHVDSLGATYRASYMADKGADMSAIMAARVPVLLASAKSNELASNLANALSDGAPAIVSNYATMLEFAAVLRSAFQAATARDAVRLGWFVNQFGLTDAQLQSIFSISAGQIAALKTRLSSLAAQYTSLQAQAGQ